MAAAILSGAESIHLPKARLEAAAEPGIWGKRPCTPASCRGGGAWAGKSRARPQPGLVVGGAPGPSTWDHAQQFEGKASQW